MERNTPSKTLWIKKEFLEYILKGRKKVEIRVGYKNIQELKTGMTLLLNGEQRVRIKNIRRYQSFTDMLKEEDVNLIGPDTSKEEVLKVLRSIYPSSKEKLGVFAIEIELPEVKSK